MEEPIPIVCLALAEPLFRKAIPLSACRGGKGGALNLLLSSLCFVVLLRLSPWPHSEIWQRIAISKPGLPMALALIDKPPPPPRLLDVGCTSITLIWASILGASKYALEFRLAGSNEEWQLISDKLSVPMVRKKNLAPGTAFEWRVAGCDAVDCTPWSEVVVFSTLDAGTKMLAAPVKLSSDLESITLQWDAPPEGAAAYTLQVRSDSDMEWSTASESIKDVIARKRGLRQGRYYAFRIKPIFTVLRASEGGAEYAFSPVSEWMSASCTTSRQVQAYIYDISRGMAKTMSKMLLGRQLDFVPHTGIVVFGKEYFFGSGPLICKRPGEAVPVPLVKTLVLGETDKTSHELEAYIGNVLALEHTEQNYNLLDHNCNHYANDLAKFLLNGRGIPDDIVNFGKDALSTPRGEAFRSMINKADKDARTNGKLSGLNPFGNNER